MLVLSRKIGEVITVGSQVEVTVISFDRGIVRLGIEAPKSIPVHRKEVRDKIVETNKAASLTKIDAVKELLSKSEVKLSKISKNKITTPTLSAKSNGNKNG